jgi:hypothetical protein
LRDWFVVSRRGDEIPAMLATAEDAVVLWWSSLEVGRVGTVGLPPIESDARAAVTIGNGGWWGGDGFRMGMAVLSSAFVVDGVLNALVAGGGGRGEVVEGRKWEK